MVRKALTVLSRVLDADVDVLQRVDEVYPVKLSRFLTQRIAEGSYGEAATRQFVPDVREFDETVGFAIDPVGESSLRPADAMVQAYNNRAAVVTTHRCLVYCRYCFRKHFVGHDANEMTPEALEQAVKYLVENPRVTDILLTGGDPLAIPNNQLLPFLERLLEVPHLKTIRIHSRAISVSPERIDREFTDYLSRDPRFWYYAHMNHPDDIHHSAVRAAIARLQTAGVPVLNQAVILAGVNDDLPTLKSLMQTCYESRVMPYNLYVLDKVRGASHFFVPKTAIAELYAGLSDLPGPAKPVLVKVDQRSIKHHTVATEYQEILNFLDRTE
jgi:glycine amidinotransferase